MTGCEPPQLLRGLRFRRERRCSSGRRILPPGERPSTGVGAKMGVSDPARVLQTWPPGPTGGVAHAPLSVSRCAGACVRSAVGLLCGLAVRSRKKFGPTFVPILRFCRDSSGRCGSTSPGVNRVWFAVAPVPNFPEALGRVKGPLRRSAPLTRPARSRVVAITGATRCLTTAMPLRRFHAFDSPRDCMRVGQMIRTARSVNW
jgi:hypothetical protein